MITEKYIVVQTSTIKNYAIYSRHISDNLFLLDSVQVKQPKLPLTPTTARFHINRL